MREKKPSWQAQFWRRLQTAQGQGQICWRGAGRGVGGPRGALHGKMRKRHGSRTLLSSWHRNGSAGGTEQTGDMQGRPEELGLSRLAGGCGEDRLKEELELFGHQGSRTFSAMHQGAGSQDALHRLGDRLVPEGRG